MKSAWEALPRPYGSLSYPALIAWALMAACHGAEDDAQVDSLPDTGGSAGAANSPLAGQPTGGTAVDDNTGGKALVDDPDQAGHAGQGGSSGLVEGNPSGSGGQSSGGGIGQGGSSLQCESQVDDGACARCLQANCCVEWPACEADASCAACSACLDAELDLGTCVVMGFCDIAPMATSKLLLCGLDACVGACGFD